MPRSSPIPSPESHAEIDFIRDDVLSALTGVEAAFGITAGDIMFDDLSLYGRYNRITGQIGLPWWNIGGNHDLNFEAPGTRYCRETYARVFGANYYAFEFGDTLFLMLDNIDYLKADPAKPRRSGKIEVFLASASLTLSPTSSKRRCHPPVAFTHSLQNYLNPDDPSTNVADKAVPALLSVAQQ